MSSLTRVTSIKSMLTSTHWLSSLLERLVTLINEMNDDERARNVSIIVTGFMREPRHILGKCPQSFSWVYDKNINLERTFFVCRVWPMHCIAMMYRSILCTFCAPIWTNCTTLIRCHQIVCIFGKILKFWKKIDCLKNQVCKLCFLFYVWWAGRPCSLHSLTATWHHHWRLRLTLWA